MPAPTPKPQPEPEPGLPPVREPDAPVPEPGIPPEPEPGPPPGEPPPPKPGEPIPRRDPGMLDPGTSVLSPAILRQGMGTPLEGGRRQGDPSRGPGGQRGPDRDGHARADRGGETPNGERG